MVSIIDQLKEKITKAFVECGYEEKFAMVSVSNRPDLCQYQCNGAMAAAKAYKKPPIEIANQIVDVLKDDACFGKIEAVMPGFINITVSGELLASQAEQMRKEDKFGIGEPEKVKTIVIDYGGPNVAKALHVGHLRPAIIGESIKRIARYMGHNVIGDVHLGDWGLQIGLIITELSKRKPELPYFDENFEGEYPTEAPFTISDLEEIYPYASGYSKEHPDYMAEAQENTAKLQAGDKAARALWNHILNVSIADLKKNYDKLDVHFDLWKKESDVEEYIPDMVQYLKDNGYAHISDGALVIDVTEETDKKELPPCIVVKSNGATLYATTDLATIVERKKLFNPDEIIYVADKRQELHFTQVFRSVKKSHLVDEDMQLAFIGHGTMNGKDGKPFKTRDGGLLRLEALQKQVTDEVTSKMTDRDFSEEETKEIAAQVGLAAIKYGDLSNQAAKDYIFDLERFASFEGNTGPYILYTIVRVKSLLAKYEKEGGSLPADAKLLAPASESETGVYLTLMKYGEMMQSAYADKAPHKICQFIYELADGFNHFYHENKILVEEDQERKMSYLVLSDLVKNVLETCIDLLGFSAPDRM